MSSWNKAPSWGMNESHPFAERHRGHLPIADQIPNRQLSSMKLANLLNNSPQRAGLHHAVVLCSERPQQAFLKLRETLAHAAGGHEEICINSWTFHELERLDFRAMARRRAANASIFVLAADRLDDPPTHIKAWIQQSFTAAAPSKPLVIGLKTNSSKCTSYLQTLANSWDRPLLTSDDLVSQVGRDQFRQLLHQRLASSVEQAAVDHVSAKPLPSSQKSNISQPEITQEIRDLAYTLWLAAGRPKGGISGFFMLAAARLQAAKQTPCPLQPYPNHEDHPHPTSSDSRVRTELLLRFQDRLPAREQSPLLQHLARVS